MRTSSKLYILQALSYCVSFGLRGMLIFYLAYALRLSYVDAIEWYVTFCILSYAYSWICGYMADTLINPFAHLIMCFISLFGGFAILSASWHTQIPLALTLIALGFSGVISVLPNLLSLLSKQRDYASKETHLKHLFVLTNLGAIIGLVLSGLYYEYSYFEYYFICAMCLCVVGLGMVKWSGARLDDPHNRWYKALPLYGILILLGTSLFYVSYLLSLLLLCTIVFAYTYLRKYTEAVPNQHLKLLLLLFVVTVLFDVFFDQITSSMNIFVDTLVGREFFFMTIPTQWLIAINPVLVLLLAPLMYAQRDNSVSNVPTQIIKALSLLALSFLCFAMGSYYDLMAQAGLFIIVVAILCSTLGEMILLPTSQAVFLHCAPEHHENRFMGLWYLAPVFSHYFGGYVAKALAKPLSESHAIHVQLSAFAKGCLWVFALLCACAFLITCLRGRLTRQ